MSDDDPTVEVRRLLPRRRDRSFFPPEGPPTSEERDLLERLIVAERHIADLRAREATLATSVRWAAYSARGLGLADVADMLESLLR